MTIKKIIKKITPDFLLSWYHYKLALLGAVLYGFPSRKLKVIGVTGTSGKSTTVDFITRILEEAGNKVASLSSIRFKVGEQEWENKYKMTMPGRFVIQKFLKQAKDADCKFVVLEVTSEGIKQHRHRFINFDAAVFTNLTPEHIESHGGFENYRNEKLKLFKATKNIHVINTGDENAKYFWDISAKQKIEFSIKDAKNTGFSLNLIGDFNILNALAAISVAKAYGISFDVCKKALEKVRTIPGRMEVVNKNPAVVVDYAHTPAQLEAVYKTMSEFKKQGKLICVLGSCGGGRDKWKRPVLGKLAGEYCDNIIITNEDPYDENPVDIINQVADGAGNKAKKISDRRQAIEKAIESAKKDDAVIITGKGSEIWMCVGNNRKIPWSDKNIAEEALEKIK